MQISRIVQAIRERWADWVTICDGTVEPLDHASLRRMSPRELADLPVEPWRCLPEGRQAGADSNAPAVTHH